MLPSLKNGRFGTSGGTPKFALVNFPKPGFTTRFSMYASGTYTVYKEGSFSGEAHPISCSVETEKVQKEDNSF